MDNSYLLVEKYSNLKQKEKKLAVGTLIGTYLVYKITLTIVTIIGAQVDVGN